ncbi:hypothetical protein GCM10027160_25050 [Streptomyces calidiresistens]|uniref:DUF4184 family protein n=1 Tax=Streptomyces calidiresistens TaxID=1485586 RepID=A0A7W3XWQ4_9ACTN|nr:DUF4184 family protein [Streptomyces calidiresistens]MBB0230078.1 DUF4184 family protein [Streptomyces calidiresistens]
MPFTLSHPAAVLPLLRHPSSPFPPAALVCGAVAPDMPYFLGSARIPVSAQSWYEPFLNATTSHALYGLHIALSFALALLLLYLAVRRPVIDLLPARFRGTGAGPGAEGVPAGPATRDAAHGLRRVGWILLSLLIGVATHLVWDSFTHYDGFVVLHVDFMLSPVAGDLTVARLLQHVSTVGGLIAIAVYSIRRVRRARRTRDLPAGVPDRAALSPGARTAARAALLVAALGGAAAGLRAPEVYRAGASGWAAVQPVAEGVLSDAAKNGGGALTAALLLYAGAWWVRRALRRTPSPEPGRPPVLPAPGGPGGADAPGDRGTVATGRDREAPVPAESAGTAADGRPGTLR